jgi:Calcineurin-like phosphoesterase
VANVVTFFDHTPGKPSRLSWSPKLDSIAVIGDTGCRFPERNQGGSADEKTGCNPPGWLFPKASRAIADPRQRPDLVLHVGDYRYRGNAGADQDKSKIYPDSWENWEADFFAPANDLLNAAPWVMTRGNHDNCFGKENKGPGWLFLLSPCPTTDDPELCRKKSEPVQERVYALDLTGSLRLVVLDAANAVNQRAKWEQKFDGEAFKKAIGEAEGRHVWLVSHYQVINIEEDERAPHALREKILAMLTGSKSKVEAVFSGDIHQLQVLGMVNPDDPSVLSKPVQFVVGNGGAARAEGFGPSMKPPNWFKPSSENEDKRGLKNEWYYEMRCENVGDPFYFQRVFASDIARGYGSCRYGFVALRREGNAWNFVPVFVSNEGEATQSEDFGCRLVEDGDESCYAVPSESEGQLIHRSEAMLYNFPASSIIGNYAYSVQGIKDSDKLVRVELGSVSDLLVRIGEGGDKQFYAVVENGSWGMEIDLRALYLDDQGYIVLDRKISDPPADKAAIEILAPVQP